MGCVIAMLMGPRPVWGTPLPTCTSTPIEIDGEHLRLDDVERVARLGQPASLSRLDAVRERIVRAWELKEEFVANGTPVYGVNTGLGDSVRHQIAAENAIALQHNLVRFLGNGTGPELSTSATRALMLIRANTLARGHSGVRVGLVERLLDLLNAGITPVIPEEGSVGASGDLVPLSYLAAVIQGDRFVRYLGEVVPAASALRAVGIEPFALEAKEALAIVNGTAFMTGIAGLVARDAATIAQLADVCTALTTEVLRASTGPFAEFLHDVAKPFPGQIQSAANVRYWLGGSELAEPQAELVLKVGRGGNEHRVLPVQIQDSYSVRCAPDFVGVLWDALEWATRWLEVEINSSTDNPLLDVSSRSVASGGNFSGGHVALTMDAIKIAVASVADLMDRQLELIVDEKFNRGLTANLIARVPAGHPDEGLHHGFKGMQLACSSLVGDALSRCMPVTIFSRSTECHNQDKVSMGATAARQARDVVTLAEKVGVIHLLALCQAADLRGVSGLGRTRLVYDRVRAHVPFVSVDRSMADDITTVLRILQDGSLLAGSNDTEA